MKSFLLVASLAVFVLFSSKSSQKNIVSAENIQKNQFKKIGVHAYYRYPRPQLSALIKEWNISTIS